MNTFCTCRKALLSTASFGASPAKQGKNSAREKIVENQACFNMITNNKIIGAKKLSENYASLPKYYILYNDSQGSKHRKRYTVHNTKYQRSVGAKQKNIVARLRVSIVISKPISDFVIL